MTFYDDDEGEIPIKVASLPSCDSLTVSSFYNAPSSFQIPISRRRSNRSHGKGMDYLQQQQQQQQQQRRMTSLGGDRNRKKAFQLAQLYLHGTPKDQKLFFNTCDNDDIILAIQILENLSTTTTTKNQQQQQEHQQHQQQPMMSHPIQKKRTTNLPRSSSINGDADDDYDDDDEYIYDKDITIDVSISSLSSISEDPYGWIWQRKKSSQSPPMISYIQFLKVMNWSCGWGGTNITEQQQQQGRGFYEQRVLLNKQQEQVNTTSPSSSLRTCCQRHCGTTTIEHEYENFDYNNQPSRKMKLQLYGFNKNNKI